MSYNDRYSGGGDQDDSRRGEGQHHQGHGNDDYAGATGMAGMVAGMAGDNSIFKTVMEGLKHRHGQLANESVDEDDMVKQHKSFFGGGGDQQQQQQPASSGNMGVSFFFLSLFLCCSPNHHHNPQNIW
jgi:hypothetical protein